MVSLAPPLDGPVTDQNRGRIAGAAPALAALSIFAVVLFAPQVLNDGDTFWHLAAGQWMLDHGRVLTTDIFSHTVAGKPWNTHEWLAEVLMALAYRAGGWSGLVVLGGVCAGAAAALLAAWLQRFLRPPTLLCVLLLSFSVTAPSLLVRPHLVALPALAFWTAGLLQAREAQRAPPLWLAGVMLVWANLHGGFVLGLALIAAFALDALVEAPAARRLAVVRDWGVFALASLAASLVTPFGVGSLLYPFQIMGMSSLPGIVEWRPADFSRVSALEIGLFAALFVLLSRGARIPPVRLLLLLLLLHMALQHTRHQIVLAVTGVMLLAEPLGAALSPPGGRASVVVGRRWIVGGALVAILLAGVRLAVPIVRSDGPTAPISALAHVPAALAARPVFNDYGFGGYLIWRGVRPFIDGRSDMYGDAFTQAYFRAVRPDAKELGRLLERYRIDWTLLAARDPSVEVMDATPGWRRLYGDKTAVVHVRDGAPRR